MITHTIPNSKLQSIHLASRKNNQNPIKKQGDKRETTSKGIRKRIITKKNETATPSIPSLKFHEIMAKRGNNLKMLNHYNSFSHNIPTPTPTPTDMQSIQSRR